MKFEDFLAENSDLESYRKEALHHIDKNKSEWQKKASSHLGVKIHKVHANGSVTDKKRFHEGSDVDVAFHYSDHSKPEGLDHEKSEKMHGHIFHSHIGHVDAQVYNTHKK